MDTDNYSLKIKIPISNAIKWRNIYIPVVCITEKNTPCLLIEWFWHLLKNIKQKQQDSLFSSFYNQR